MGAWHVAAEEVIAASGLGWTVVRPPSFASNFLQYRAMIDAGDPLPNLFDAQAAILERILDRPVKTTAADLDAQLAATGMPPEAIAQVTTGARWAGAGGAEYVTEHVSRILGRPAGTFEQWATHHRAMFNAMR